MVAQLILILFALLGAISTYFLSTNLKQGSVRSSALLSLIIALIFNWSPELPYQLSTEIPLVFIGASFVGMVSSSVNSNYATIGFGGLIFGLIFISMGGFFNGYGGGLGTAACISLMASMGIGKTYGRFIK